jgi:hypothetical protein
MVMARIAVRCGAYHAWYFTTASPAAAASW